MASRQVVAAPTTEPLTYIVPGWFGKKSSAKLEPTVGPEEKSFVLKISAFKDVHFSKKLTPKEETVPLKVTLSKLEHPMNILADKAPLIPAGNIMSWKFGLLQFIKARSPIPVNVDGRVGAVKLSQPIKV